MNGSIVFVGVAVDICSRTNVVLIFCAQTIIKETFVSIVPETRGTERQFVVKEKLSYRTNSMLLEYTTNMDFVLLYILHF